MENPGTVIKIARTDSDNPDFRKLVEQLDQMLRVTDGEEHPFFAQFNKLDSIKNVVVAYSDNVPAGCGSMKQYSDGIAEIKRMFVTEQYRKNGIAKKILTELELWAYELNYSDCILETARMLTDAVNFYKNSGYEVIPNFGQYEGQKLSICMKKKIR